MTDKQKDEVVAGMYVDLLAIQKEIKDVSKDATNPFFKSRYATLGATIEACKDIVNNHNFVILQPIQSDIDGVYVCTTLYHISGGTIESKLRIDQKEKSNPQAQGSAITYARRYALQSILCMNAEDDDANIATGKPKETSVKTEPTRAEIKESKVCPKCQGNLIERTTKAGKLFFKCENGGWDPDNQVATGCDYVLWSTPKVDYDKKHPYADPSKVMSVEEYEKQSEPTPEYNG